MSTPRASGPPSSARTRSPTGSPPCPPSRRSSTPRASSSRPRRRPGIDVVCDGELYRFDVNHPETNGMIEYFVRPLDGVRTRMSFEELFAYRAGKMGFRGRPPGVVEGPIGAGHARTAGRLRAREAARDPPVQVHADRAAHAGEDARRPALQVDRGPRARDRRRARRAGEAPRRRGRPGRRGQPPGRAGRMGVGGGGDQPRARRGEDHARGAPVLRQLRRPVAAARHLGAS